MGGGKGGSPKQQVTEYYMALHMGLCVGPIDAVTGVYYGEKRAWQGNQTNPGVVQISKRSLFGGPKKEGGVAGAMVVLPGDASQVLPEEIAARMGLTPHTCPAYRGIASVFFVAGSDWDGTYPPASNEVEIPPDGLPVATGNRLVGFTVAMSVQDREGLIIPAGSDLVPDPRDLPQVGLGLNVAELPPDGFLAGSLPDGSAYLTNRHEYATEAPVPPSVVLSPVRSDAAVKGLTSVTESDSDTSPANPTRYYCVYNGLTGQLDVHRDGGGTITGMLPPLEFTLHRFDSNQLYGAADLVVTGDVSNPVFPPDVVPITDVV